MQQCMKSDILDEEAPEQWYLPYAGMDADTWVCGGRMS